MAGLWKIRGKEWQGFTTCRLRMKYNTHLGNKWTRQKYSDPYYIGIEVHPRHILTKECDKPFDITLRTTVPIHILPHPLLPIKIFATLLTTNNVGIFDNCQVAFSHGDDVGTTYNVRVRSVCDTLIDGQSRVVHILFKGPSDSLPSLIWDDYILPRVRVTVEQTENRECRTYNDPHFSTFDGKYYPFLHHGDYVLFQDNDHHTEVHTRLWTCWDSSASCNCGVAIRERNDVMILSICNSQLQHQANTPIPMTFRVPSGHLPNGTHIYRQISGTQVTHTVLLPSGTKVEVIRLDWGMNIKVNAFKNSNSIRGLCGNMNGDSNDEFQHGGDGHSHADATRFGLSWRKQPHESYFHILPSNHLPDQIMEKTFCACGETRVEDCKPLLEIIYPQNPPGVEVPPDQFEGQGETYSDFSMDQQDADYFTDEHNERYAKSRIRARRSIEMDRMTRQNATRLCKTLIEDTVVGKSCSALPNVDAASTLQSCIFDLMVTGNAGFAVSALESLKSGCQDEAYNNLTLYTKDAEGNPSEPPADIVENLCPNECSNHGNCSNSTCICEEGFTSLDCSLSINTVPELLGIHDGGLCDIRRRPCKKTNIFGDGFIPSENLTCHATEFKVYGNNWTPNSSPHELQGEQFDLFGVKCSLPDPPTKIGDYDNPGTPAGGLYIRISNNKIDASLEKMRFISYDSVCMRCSKTGTCVLRQDSCLINGHCFAQNDAKPNQWCRQCQPDTSQFTWSRRKVNSPPVFTTLPVQFALVGEMFSLQIEALDPDNRRVTYSLANTDAQGYVFTPDGQLNITMTTSDSKTFKFVATDECNASDTTTVTVKAMECPCQHGGTCHPHPYHPRGSGQYECACPAGFNGSRCESDIDDCQSSLCVNGTCIDGINNYTCRCHVGYKGALCDEKERICGEDTCYPGVKCREIPDGVLCRSCPDGLIGDGKTCIAPVTTTRPQSTQDRDHTNAQESTPSGPTTQTPTDTLPGMGKKPAKQASGIVTIVTIVSACSAGGLIIIGLISWRVRKYMENRKRIHSTEGIKADDADHCYDNPIEMTPRAADSDHTYEEVGQSSTYESLKPVAGPPHDAAKQKDYVHAQSNAYQELEKRPAANYQDLVHWKC
ncbi:von Willebrand factor D and EGF domain-containing protein isoform X3 [Nematostella vectensis]|uniref:von Willebrand factor D and EGF domain-containing protein isoform X3 n=1 Tax=Nematostella vectensis TaxID=45351 RepID=UPI0020776868|nr:von Willebrand factor D and EGF domain-containing protein isoform X3 [Nematostella vectensis]